MAYVDDIPPSKNQFELCFAPITLQSGDSVTITQTFTSDVPAGGYNGKVVTSDVGSSWHGWHGGFVGVVSGNVFAKPAPSPASSAAEWLTKLLAAGPSSEEAIRAAAEAAGYTWALVCRLADQMGFRPAQNWSLPAEHPLAGQ